MIDSETFPAAIAAELRAELARQNRSKRWMAIQLGHSHVTVGRWLAGATPVPLCDFVRICEALGVPPAAVLARVGVANVERRRSEDFRVAA